MRGIRIKFPMCLSAVLTIIPIIAVTMPAALAGDDEVTLFDRQGKANAYIAADDDMTIYLWSGKPVAYLDSDSAGGFHVYGFNGKHLGWFVSGAVWDHDGNAGCAVKERLQRTEFEPYKGYKQYKPYQSYKEYAPYRPYFSTSWGDTPCRFLLAEGAK